MIGPVIFHQSECCVRGRTCCIWKTSNLRSGVLFGGARKYSNARVGGLEGDYDRRLENNGLPCRLSFLACPLRSLARAAAPMRACAQTTCFLASHARRPCLARAVPTNIISRRRFAPCKELFLEKTDCFTVVNSDFCFLE